MSTSNFRPLLDDTYKNVMESANTQMNWYERKKNTKSKWSRRLRFFSIVLFGIGGIFPLIGKIESLKFDGTYWGYIAIASAGTLLFLDRFFGFSSGWIRYVTTQLEINRQKNEFEMKWQIEMARIDFGKNELTCDLCITILNMLKDFTSLVDELVKQETANWAAEFQTNIAELQKMSASKLETRQPGSIRVVVKNATNYKNLLVKTNNITRKKLIGSETLLDNITPGPHEVCILAETIANNQEISVNSVIVVESNKMTVSELTLP